MARSPEQIDFLKQGLKLGNFIERRLGVRMASLTNPGDLAVIGASVYAPEEVKFKYPTSIKKHAKEVADSYDPIVYHRLGITKLQLINAYPDLVVRGNDYSRGNIASALREAGATLTPEESEELQIEFANLAAKLFKLEPKLVKNPGISLSPYPAGSTFYSSDTWPLYKGPTPKVFVEYGPGLMGYKRLEGQLDPINVSFLIENSLYVNQLLFEGARLNGYSTNLTQVPAVIARRDGIRSATSEMLSAGLSDQVDTIIMSMTQSAGIEEIISGIDHGHRLLKPGGIFIAQHPYDLLEPGDAPGTVTLEALKTKFGDSEKNMSYLQDFQSVQPTTGRNRRLFRAVFIK